MLGREELTVFIVGTRLKQLTFQSWQLPRSTRTKLRIATILYRQQIKANWVVVHDIEWCE